MNTHTYNGKRVLVTGGAGFIGSNIVWKLNRACGDMSCNGYFAYNSVVWCPSQEGIYLLMVGRSGSSGSNRFRLEQSNSNLPDCV